MTAWDGQVTYVSLQRSNKQLALSVACMFSGKNFPYTCLRHSFNLWNISSYVLVQIHTASIFMQIYNINSRFKVTAHGTPKYVSSILQAREVHYDAGPKDSDKSTFLCPQIVYYFFFLNRCKFEITFTVMRRR